ncbi:hypothetical protein DsansV1_C15g0133491 [Dioscorea sansibarensis]
MSIGEFCLFLTTRVCFLGLAPLILFIYDSRDSLRKGASLQLGFSLEIGSFCLFRCTGTTGICSFFFSCGCQSWYYFLNT